MPIRSRLVLNIYSSITFMSEYMTEIDDDGFFLNTTNQHTMY